MTQAATENIPPEAASLVSNATSQIIQSWYAVNKADEEEAEVSIYGLVGDFGISASQFIRDLKAAKSKVINVRINSGGGSVFDGVAISSALKAMKARIVTHIDGVAASIASVIAIAGDEVRMAKNAFLMIHNPMMAGGITADSSELRRMANTLDKMRDLFANTYAERTKKKPEEMAKLMDEETWLTADEAKELGFIDQITGEIKATASLDLSNFSNVPTPAKSMWGLPQNQTLPVPPVGETAPVVTQESSTMADTSTQSPPAQTPAAVIQGTPQGNTQEIARLTEQARQSYIENGRKLGVEEGRNSEMSRMQKLVEAAPGRPDLVIDAFVTKQEPGALSLAFKAVQQASSRAATQQQENEVEIARLTALIASGGHSGVPGHMTQEIEQIPQYDLEPEARAKMEWDSNPNLRAQHKNNEKAFMLFRVNQLNGNIRVLKTA